LKCSRSQAAVQAAALVVVVFGLAAVVQADFFIQQVQFCLMVLHIALLLELVVLLQHLAPAADTRTVIKVTILFLALSQQLAAAMVLVFSNLAALAVLVVALAIIQMIN
jgi:hypothetical protein